MDNLEPSITQPGEKNSTNEKDLGLSAKIVGILLKEGVLTRKQVDYAFRVQAKLENPRPLLGVIQQLKYISHDQIYHTIRTNLSTLQLEDILLELNFLTLADLEKALRIQMEEKTNRTLREILIRNNILAENKMIEIYSEILGLPFIELQLAQIDKRLFSQGSPDLYETHEFIPICARGKEIQVTFADPLNPLSLEKAKTIFGAQVSPAVSTGDSIREMVKKMQENRNRGRVEGPAEDSIVKIVDSILSAAVENDNISDIHIEPMEDRLQVRFRQDGVLLFFQRFSPHLIGPIATRIKVLCGADITEKRRHQGGRFFFERGTQKSDFRVSFYVTVHGEKIVLRLLNRKKWSLNVEDMGMSSRMLRRFCDEVLIRPTGIMVITGPTGSGKTTTVYSCINFIKSPQISIITAEDPVEYMIDGIAQCSINPAINLTYEETLRHIVRQDTDVIVIGEIRDKYSAQVAVQAALTGHKVLTTFHTEDSIGGLIRLLNMDIEAFLISSTVMCIVSQRLIRKICPACKEPYQPKPWEFQLLGLNPKEVTGIEFGKGVGCSECGYTGYKGRIAVFELLILNEPMRSAILQWKTSQEIRSIALETTELVTLLEDGLYKASLGITTLEEILRGLPILNRPRPLPKLKRLLGEME